MAWGEDQETEIRNRLFEKNGGYKNISVDGYRIKLPPREEWCRSERYGCNEVANLFDPNHDPTGNIDDLYKKVPGAGKSLKN